MVVANPLPIYAETLVTRIENALAADEQEAAQYWASLLHDELQPFHRLLGDHPWQAFAIRVLLGGC